MRFHQATLSNGLQVVAELNDQAHSVASGFFVKTGSRDESTEVAGVSHFLEHMIFKGTATRNALAVNRDFDRVGAKHNAQTSEEDTFYHVTTLPEYLPGAFDVLSDILRPSLRAEDFETEKKVIIEEIRMYLDDPMSVAYEAAKVAHFGSHALGQSILGSVGSISEMTIEQMRDYFERRYVPSNIVLAFAGKSNWDDVLALAESRCGSWKAGVTGRQAVVPKGSGAFETWLRSEDNQQTTIAMADAPPLESDDRHAAQLLSAILGDQSGSRLYWALIDPGHADSAWLGYQEFNQAGMYFAFLSCDPEDTESNLARMTQVFRQAMSEGVTEQELTRAKNKVLSRSVIRGERPMGRLTSLGYYWAYQKKYLTVEQEIESYQRVTREEIAQVMQRWPLQPLTIVSVGPKTDMARPS